MNRDFTAIQFYGESYAFGKRAAQRGIDGEVLHDGEYKKFYNDIAARLFARDTVVRARAIDFWYEGWRAAKLEEITER